MDKVFSYPLDVDVQARMSKASKRTGIKKAWIVNAAIIEWLDKHAGPETHAGKESDDE